MGELSDRRARKKAQTRQHIRTVAQEMFAAHGFDGVTTVDIAKRAAVAVQTVFNHFPTKEELFFDGRTSWVSGPADAVRDRAPGTCPLDALRTYLVTRLPGLVDSVGEAERQAYVHALESSDVLRVRERELVFDSEQQLTAALREAWSEDPRSDRGPTPRDPATAAAVTAAIWLSATRALMVGHRTLAAGGLDALVLAHDLGALADHLIGGPTASADRPPGQRGEPTDAAGRPLPTRRAG